MKQNYKINKLKYKNNKCLMKFKGIFNKISQKYKNKLFIIY